ncbi:MAG: response regulator, partial [Cyanobacteria bacterium REEB65]|nr:response regulator [Cyanobacteria bacterium REEB65]
PGSGSSFSVALPASHVAKPFPEADPQQGPPRILVVDDDPNYIHLLKVVLESEGYLVIGATSAGEALELALHENPGLILTDLMMPDLDGWGLVERLSEDPQTRDIPVAILSALRPDYVATRFRSIQYLEKSGHPRTLLPAIRDLLAGSAKAQS